MPNRSRKNGGSNTKDTVDKKAPREMKGPKGRGTRPNPAVPKDTLGPVGRKNTR